VRVVVVSAHSSCGESTTRVVYSPSDLSAPDTVAEWLGVDPSGGD